MLQALPSTLAVAAAILILLFHQTTFASESIRQDLRMPGGVDDWGALQGRDLAEVSNWFRTVSGADSRRVGAIGFSQGGQVALIGAWPNSGIETVVTFFRLAMFLVGGKLPRTRRCGTTLIQFAVWRRQYGQRWMWQRASRYQHSSCTERGTAVSQSNEASC